MSIVLGGWAAPAAGAAGDQPVRLVVGIQRGVDAAAGQQLRQQAGVRLERRWSGSRIQTVLVAPGEERAALARLRQDPRVRWAQTDGRVRISANDPRFAEQWGLHNATLIGADIGAPLAWKSSTGEGILVAVIDTGVQSSHPDLAGAIWNNPGETAGNGIDDDANGYVDDVHGWDWVQHDATPQDEHGHGSHVAGILGARFGDGTGIAGVAPSDTIMPLRVLDAGGGGSNADVAAAMLYAAQKGAKIVNLSLGGSSYSQAQVDVITAHPEVLFVVAAGNDGTYLDTATGAKREYPCQYDQANVLCVGASWYSSTSSCSSGPATTEPHECAASFSNFGTRVRLWAPGKNILSLDRYNGWVTMSGTSMAAPMVAGGAALVWAVHPGWTPTQISSALIASADSKPLLTWQAAQGSPVAPQAPRLNLGAALSGEADGDRDAVLLAQDNCPSDYNPDQADTDWDGQGDVCDPTPQGTDSDGDGRFDLQDNCPAQANPDQADADRDGQGDACDATPRGRDWDNDGRGALDDNCPDNYNPDQADTDRDGQGDACDPTPRGPDRDRDRVPDMDDNCPAEANRDQRDLNRDGRGDPCDLQPIVQLGRSNVRGTRLGLRATCLASGPLTVRVQRARGRAWVTERTLRINCQAATTVLVQARARYAQTRYRMKLQLRSRYGAGREATSRTLRTG